MVGIYKITNIKNGKYYIGSSKDIINRLSKHFSELKSDSHRNKHLQSSYNKYGLDSFKSEIIEVCLIQDIIAREQYYIDQGNWAMMYNKTKQAYGGGSDNTTKEYVLLDLDGNVLDRFYSGRDLKRYLNIKSRDIDYKSINTNNKFLGTYRIVSLDFFNNYKDIIYSWKNFDEIYENKY